LREEGVDEDLYANVENLAFAGYSEQERLAIEFAERFVYDHLRMDDEFWSRLRAAFRDDEIMDLTLCVGSFLALGRTLVVLGLDHEH
jgi:hypothetical protein